MERGNFMADTRNSSNVNRELLQNELGLRRLANTTIFLGDNTFILSPSVQNQYKWFDVRKVNLDRYHGTTYKGYLLIRYFNKLLFTDLEGFIQKMITTDKYVDNQNIGVHWKFNIEQSQEEYTIRSRQDRTITYTLNEYNVADIKRELL